MRNPPGCSFPGLLAPRTPPTSQIRLSPSSALAGVDFHTNLAMVPAAPPAST